MNPSPAAAPSRLYFLDWLRIAAFALLIVYHVGMYYVSWAFHIKSPAAGTTIEPFMRLSGPWRLSLLFLVSGAATSFMLARGVDGAFVRGRSKRLLLPLLFGILVIVPPQSYFEVVQKLDYSGSYLDFLRLYFSGYDGFFPDGKRLILPTWNHLWFVVYLWFYTVLLWALVRARPVVLDTLARHAERVLAGARLILLPMAGLAVLRIALVARFPSTHALVDDWFNHALYFSMFLAGAVFARTPQLWRRFAALRWLALAAALCAWGLLVTYSSHYGAHSPAPEWLRQGQRVVFAAMQWCAIVAALGFARQHLNIDHRARRYLTDAVFPVYILHQTLIILLAVALRPLQWAPAIEGPALVAGTFVLSFAGYELVRRVRTLRPWFGLTSLPPRPRTPAARGEVAT